MNTLVRHEFTLHAIRPHVGPKKARDDVQHRSDTRQGEGKGEGGDGDGNSDRQRRGRGCCAHHIVGAVKVSTLSHLTREGRAPTSGHATQAGRQAPGAPQQWKE